MLQPSVLKAINDDYAERRKEIQGNMSYRLGTESLGKEGKKKVKAEAQTALAEAKKEYEAKVAEYNAKKSAYDALSPEEKASRAKKEEAIKAEYAERAKKIEDKYAEIIKQIESNVEGVSAKLQPIEQTKATEANTQVAETNKKYADLKAAKTQELTDAIEQAKAKVATSNGPEKDVAVIELKEAKRAKIDGLAMVTAEHNAAVDDVLFQSKVFVAYINGHAFETSLDINKKIVKGLGAQLFLSHYRFEVPHDAYALADDGIALTVESIVDYGTDQYAKCSLYGDTVYVKVDKAYENGDVLSINVDVTKARIFENLFDIRLY